MATPEDIAWADLILVMEPTHQRELSRRFQPHLRDKRAVVLGIKDDFDYLQPELVALLRRVVPPHLP